MNRFAVQDADAATGVDPEIHAFGPFDPADPAAGDMAFLAEDQALFQQFDSLLRVPFSDEAPETHWAMAPALMPGATLQTDKGEVQVQDLIPGQRILTRDRGFQTVLWAGHCDLPADAMQTDTGLRPVLIRAGALGPNLPAKDMTVAQSQRLLVEGPLTKLMFGQREVFVPAAYLIGYPGIEQAPATQTRAVRILCANHEVIWADGIWTETHQAGAYAPAQMNKAQAIEIEMILLENSSKAMVFTSARRTLKRHEADLLLA
jgi:hypothetical protein